MCPQPFSVMSYDNCHFMSMSRMTTESLFTIRIVGNVLAVGLHTVVFLL